MTNDSPAINNKSGFWVYNSFVLRIYDFLVPGFLNRFVWRCPTRKIHSLYRRLLGPNHLDIGIGSGYFLDRFFRDQKKHRENNATLLGTECYCERLVLADAHPTALRYCQDRLWNLGVFAEGQIENHQIDVTNREQLSRLVKQAELDGKMDSVAANYLIHCLPKGLLSSDPLMAFAKQVLAEDGIFFGSTILGSETDKHFRSRLIAGVFRRAKIFGQQKDRLEEFQSLLNKHFPFCDIEMSGCVVLFVASCQDFNMTQ